jgi:hypothetical protein
MTPKALKRLVIVVVVVAEIYLLFVPFSVGMVEGRKTCGIALMYLAGGAPAPYVTPPQLREFTEAEQRIRRGCAAVGLFRAWIGGVGVAVAGAGAYSRLGRRRRGKHSKRPSGLPHFPENDPDG